MLDKALTTSTPTAQNIIFGQFVVESSLSFRKNSIKYTNKIKFNLVSIENPLYTEHKYRALPIHFKHKKLDIVTKNWQLNLRQKSKNISHAALTLQTKNHCSWSKILLPPKKECNFFFVKKGKIEL